MLRALVVSAAVLALLGCKKEESRPITQGPPGAAMVNVDREVSLLRDILQKDPQNLQAWIKLGNITMDAGRFSEAVEAYGKALEMDPVNVNVRVDRGTCYRRMGRSDLAREHFEEALAINPNHQYANMNLGVVLAYDLNQQKDAVRYFEKYLEVAPTAPNAPDLRKEIERLKALP
jgi:Flp pilus assembly protein TadD